MTDAEYLSLSAAERDAARALREINEVEQPEEFLRAHRALKSARSARYEAQILRGDIRRPAPITHSGP